MRFRSIFALVLCAALVSGDFSKQFAGVTPSQNGVESLLTAAAVPPGLGSFGYRSYVRRSIAWAYAHSGLSRALAADPHLTLVQKLLPQRVAFHSMTVTFFGRLTSGLLAPVSLPYMSPTRIGGNSLGLFYGVEQQLTLPGARPGHGGGDFVSARTVVEAVAYGGGDFYALWPYMMTTVTGAPYNVLAQLLLDPKKANVEAFVEEIEAQGPAVLSAYRRWQGENAERIEKTSKARRMPHAEREKLNLEAMHALWSDLQAHPQSPMRQAFEIFKRAHHHDFDEELTYLTLRLRHLRENGDTGWDWRTWKEQGLYRSKGVRDLKKDVEFAAQMQEQFFIQFILYRQLDQLATFAHERGVEISVDKPVGMDGVTWNRHIFDVAGDANARLETQGVKADYFGRFGQYWQFWLQNAKAFLSYHLAWIEALLKQGALVLRIDHALGFFRIQHWVEDAKGALSWEKLGLWPEIQSARAAVQQAWADNDETKLKAVVDGVREAYARKLLSYWDDATALGLPKDAVQKIFRRRDSTELAEDAAFQVWRSADAFGTLVGRIGNALSTKDVEQVAEAILGHPSRWTAAQRPIARELAARLMEDVGAKGEARLWEIVEKAVRDSYLLGAPWTRQNVVEERVHRGRWEMMYLRITPAEVAENQWDDGWLLNYLLNDVDGPRETDSIRPAYYVLGPGGKAVAEIGRLAQQTGALIYYEFLGAMPIVVDDFLRLFGLSRLQPSIYYSAEGFDRRDVATYGLTDSHGIQYDWEVVRTREKKEEMLKGWGLEVTEERLTRLTREIHFHLLAMPAKSKARGLMYTINDVLGLSEIYRMNEPGVQVGQFEAGVPMYVEHFRDALKAAAHHEPIPMSISVTQEQDREEYAFQVRSRELARDYVEMMTELRKIRPNRPAEAVGRAQLIDVEPGLGVSAHQLRYRNRIGVASFDVDATTEGPADRVFVTVRNANNKVIGRVQMRPVHVQRGIAAGRQVWRAQWPTRQVGHFTFQVEVLTAKGEVALASDIGQFVSVPYRADTNPQSPGFFFGSVEAFRLQLSSAYHTAKRHAWERSEFVVEPASPADERVDVHAFVSPPTDWVLDGTAEQAAEALAARLETGDRDGYRTDLTALVDSAFGQGAGSEARAVAALQQLRARHPTTMLEFLDDPELQDYFHFLMAVSEGRADPLTPDQMTARLVYRLERLSQPPDGHELFEDRRRRHMAFADTLQRLMYFSGLLKDQTLVYPGIGIDAPSRYAPVIGLNEIDNSYLIKPLLQASGFRTSVIDRMLSQLTYWEGVDVRDTDLLHPYWIARQHLGLWVKGVFDYVFFRNWPAFESFIRFWGSNALPGSRVYFLNYEEAQAAPALASLGFREVEWLAPDRRQIVEDALARMRSPKNRFGSFQGRDVTLPTALRIYEKIGAPAEAPDRFHDPRRSAA